VIAPAGRGLYPTEAAQGDLNLRPFQAVTQQIFAGSTGEGDNCVQAYHYRLCLTNDPANRRLPARPENYDPDFIRSVADGYRSLGGGKPNAPNGKIHRFQNLPGGVADYPTADWPRRHEIMKRHRDFALGVVYFLQNDPSPAVHRRLGLHAVSPHLRRSYREHRGRGVFRSYGGSEAAARLSATSRTTTACRPGSTIATPSIMTCRRPSSGG
jgi:hypothetical protein